MTAPQSLPFICVLFRAGAVVGAEAFRRPDLKKAEAAALALALVRLDCDSYELWQGGTRLAVVLDKLAKATDLLWNDPPS